MQMPDKEKPGQFIDIGFVANQELIGGRQALQDDAFIPIISPIVSARWPAYNINADLVAAKLPRF